MGGGGGLVFDHNLALPWQSIDGDDDGSKSLLLCLKDDSMFYDAEMNMDVSCSWIRKRGPFRSWFGRKRNKIDGNNIVYHCSPSVNRVCDSSSVNGRSSSVR